MNAGFFLDKVMKLQKEEVLETLRRDGISVQEGYISGDLLDEVRSEFDRFLATEEEGVMHVEHKPGKAFRIVLNDPKLRALNRRKSRIASLFFDEDLREIADTYLPDASYCNGLLGTNEFRAMPVTEVHFDTLRSLKFMIYLDDTNAENGAFSYARGTHRRNSAYRNRFAAL